VGSPAVVRVERTLVGVSLAATLLVGGVVSLLLFSLLRRGYSGLDPRFIFGLPQDAGRAGGIAPVLVSTVLILLVCLAAALPVGLGAAIYLAEFADADRPGVRAMQRSLDLLAAVPSVVFGLLGNALFCRYLGMGYSIISGGLTLACMVLPMVVRTAEVALRTAPPELRHAAAALGMSKSTVIVWVVIPASAAPLLAGVFLALARAAAETAALVFTSGYVDRMPRALTDSGRSISVHIYDLAMNVSGGDANAARTSVVLLFGLAALSVLTRRLVGTRSKE
jgi:phosphate transport system permease protein